ncbi:MAG: hypothetical protein LC785_14965 [Acidobacteria bacterium]|nr:hypothetical protein [Acidobacteriota bacterium]MCA1643212.1 hypothetical protein [Acidobacteriota bacterium]
MKFSKLPPLLLILCATVLFAQRPVGVAQQRDARVKGGIFIKEGKEVKVEGEDLKLGFVSVAEDSRCPEGATCVWAGNARVRLTARNSKDECAEFDLNTYSAPLEYAFGKYTIRIAGLAPHPSIHHGSPKPGEYTATLAVTKNKKD